MTNNPVVFVAILAKQKEKMLPAWLDSLSKWDYPKDRMILYVRSNNNTDNTAKILKDWLDTNRKWYRLVVEDYTNLDTPVQNFGVHEWNATRFKVLGDIRNRSVELAWHANANFYWVVDVDNFVKPDTLSKMVRHNLPVVAPLLKMADPEQPAYSNYHLLTNVRGYFLDDIRYYQVLKQEIKGLINCDVVHCTYLIRSDIFDSINYIDGTDDYEYVIFSRNLRSLGIPQYLDNEEVYGYLSTRENVDAIIKNMKTL
jgi:Glycosyl transferase family 2